MPQSRQSDYSHRVACANVSSCFWKSLCTPGGVSQNLVVSYSSISLVDENKRDFYGTKKADALLDGHRRRMASSGSSWRDFNRPLGRHCMPVMSSSRRHAAMSARKRNTVVALRKRPRWWRRQHQWSRACIASGWTTQQCQLAAVMVARIGRIGRDSVICHALRF